MELISSRKMRALVGGFEAAGAVVDGAGEGAADVAEQLAFEQAFAEGAAVDADERAVAALAEAVDGVGDQLLAGAGFAEQQHRRAGAGHLPRGAEHLGHGGAGADDAGQRRGGGVVGGGGRGVGMAEAECGGRSACSVASGH